MNTNIFTKEDVADFNRDGYIVKRGYFNTKEISKVYNVAQTDTQLKNNALDIDDQSGLKTKLTIWYNAGNHIYGKVVRSQRMVNAVTSILGGTVAHFHTKLMQKEPKVGGAWEWHQDYGYWYHDGFLFPDMISVMVALNEANQKNGCLQVLKGSHKLGRVDHGATAEQVGISERLIETLRPKFKLVYVELNPGDTLFFHCNLLHRSDANLSDKSRWSLISAYNLVSNKPYMDANESCITPIESLPDSAILLSDDLGVDENADFINHEKHINWQEGIDKINDKI